MSVHRLTGEMYDRIQKVAETLGFSFIPQAVCYIDHRLGFAEGEIEQVKDWCRLNFKGKWIIRLQDTLYIESLDDASLFELAFGKPR